MWKAEHLAAVGTLMEGRQQGEECGEKEEGMGRVQHFPSPSVCGEEGPSHVSGVGAVAWLSLSI